MIAIRLASFLVTFMLVMLTSCGKDESCSGEKAKAIVQSNSSINKVWVTFNNNTTKQAFQIQDVTEGNSKATSPLPAGSYYVQIWVYYGSSRRDINVSADFKDCFDYNVGVNSFSSSPSVSISRKPR